MHQPDRNPLLLSQEQTAVALLFVNANKTEFMRFQQKGAISTLSGNPKKLLDQLTNPGSNISSTES